MNGWIRYYLEDTPLTEESGGDYSSFLNINSLLGFFPSGQTPNVYTGYAIIGNVILDEPLSGAEIKDPLFNVNYSAPETSAATYLDNIQVRLLYRILPVPDITVSPSVDYGSFTRLGPNNTPAIVEFEIEEVE